MARVVHVLPHTHWDREWYEPFPTFRIRLVELLDDLLPRLESPDGLPHFQLDGQMAVIDDYLEVRPGAADRLRRLNASGRLSMGPWYVLPDEFLVSGETLVRNLQMGMRRAEEFGGAMRVGYLPDMFGHIAAMPQLLRLFGIDQAVVWRGVPSTVGTPAFRWRSPDGSTVRAEYLSAGYGNGSDMPADPAELADRIDLFAAAQGPLVGDRLLWMAGMDHEAPPEHLTRVVTGLDRQDGWSLSIGSLADYLGSGDDREQLPVHEGELRSGARANLLMGVASNRVDVKVAAARAERALERIAEPLVALWSADPDRWSPLLEVAWREVVRNAAHDSICACSHDEVVDAVLHRYAEATRTAEGVAAHALEDAAALMAEPGPYLLNPGAEARAEVVELEVPATEPPDGIQVLQEYPEESELHVTGAEDAPLVVARELIFEHPGTRTVGILAETADDGGPGLRLDLWPSVVEGAATPADALAELGQRCDAEPALRVRTVLHRPHPTRRVLVMSPRVPGFGWAAVHPAPTPHTIEPVGAHGLTNGLVTVAADAATGTFSLDGLAGFGRLVDAGDAGDTYNWCPPDHDVVVEQPASVTVERTESGPMRGLLLIRCALEVPEGVHRREDGTWERGGPQRSMVVETRVELRAGEPFVRVTTRLDHDVRDHRLRVHHPLPRRAGSSTAECAYGTVTRGLSAEGGANEWGVATFPSRRFVTAGGLVVVHEGLCEYELTDLDGEATEPTTTAAELALTLVRATGWLSRGPMRSRPLPAGPELALEGSQVRRRLELRYAVGISAGLDPWAVAEQVFSPLLVTHASGGGTLGQSGSRLEATGMAVDALVPDGSAMVLRGHEPSGRPGGVAIVAQEGRIVDLRGEDLGPFDGERPLRPHEILTVRLDRPATP
jgi:mannosylglycerate hydrolase